MPLDYYDRKPGDARREMFAGARRAWVVWKRKHFSQAEPLPPAPRRFSRRELATRIAYAVLVVASLFASLWLLAVHLEESSKAVVP